MCLPSQLAPTGRSSLQTTHEPIFLFVEYQCDGTRLMQELTSGLGNYLRRPQIGLEALLAPEDLRKKVLLVGTRTSQINYPQYFVCIYSIISLCVHIPSPVSDASCVSTPIQRRSCSLQTLSEDMSKFTPMGEPRSFGTRKGRPSSDFERLFFLNMKSSTAHKSRLHP